MEKKFPIFKILTLLVWLVLGMGTAFAAWDGTSKTQPVKEGDYYIINTEAELAWYAANYSNWNARLNANLDLGGHLWIPIAPGQGNARYAKIFDGNGHVIKNLYINGTELAQIDKNYAQNLGFVGTLGGGTIKNLILENVDIQASTNAGDILGRDDSQISVGAFVGWMADKVTKNVVENCVVASGTIRTTGNGQGVGGIVGNAKVGTITNCMSLVEIRTSGSQAYIGGIIGITKTDVTVASCVYAGPGLVNTGSNGAVGGITGNVYSGKMTATDDYYEGENYYEGNEVGGVGKNCGQNCTVHTESVEQVSESNKDEVVCVLNGSNSDGSCKEEPWSLGETGLSLNGYGIDGYKIVFNANGGLFANGKNTTNKFLQTGMAITDDEIGKPTREAYTFKGWALTSDATAPAADLGTVSQTETIFAVWEKKIKVTFDANGGAFPDAAKAKDVYITKGDPITVDGLGSLPVSYCREYSVSNSSQCVSTMYFTGWKNDAGNTIDFNNHDVLATVDVTYKAIWTNVITYSVTFHANNNTTVDIVVFVDQGTTTSRPDDPTMDGYNFVGWFDGDAAFNFGSQIESSKDLYAHWTPKQYNVTYVLSDGGLNKGDNPVIFTLGEGLLALNPPTAQDGYTFDGWFYDSDFKQKATAIDRNVVGDKTFYAKWTKKTYRIMYLADNNSQGAVTDQFKEHGSPVTLESAGHFNRKGYAQTGWATVANGEKVYEFGATYEENAALTLYPSWSYPIEYTITYVCEGCVNDPQNPETYTVLTNKGIKYASSVPEGYRFGGWFSDKKYTNKVTKIETGTVGNLTLYGKLNTIYNITYVLNGSANDYNPDDYTVDDGFTLNDPAPVEGYTFGGWFDNAKFEGNAVTEIVKGSTGDITLYAKWYPYVVQYGAVTVTENADGTKTATINDGYTGTDAVYIPNSIEVDNIIINRTFTPNTPSTIMLPFKLPVGTNLNGAKFYYLKSVAQEEGKNTWKATMKWIGSNKLPEANKPYGVICPSSTLEFDLGDGKASLQTAQQVGSDKVYYEVSGGNWHFVGTYAYNQWEETDEDFELAYALAGKAGKGLRAGDFGKVTNENWTYPLRSYMRKKDNTVQLQPLPQAVRARGASYGLNNIGSEIIEVEFVDDEKTTAIGHMNTVTGEIKIDRWFDLKGRRVKNVNRAAKGAYYGKKVFHE